VISFLSLACGALAAGGTYLLFRQRLFDLLIGLTLLGHSINLSLFVASINSAAPPSLIAPEQTVLASHSLDPVPQALILTAIVIGFGTIALLAVLVRSSKNQTEPETGKEGKN
jgi:multisubunit Na+/H+ antiporter MnhC subunit